MRGATFTLSLRLPKPRVQFAPAALVEGRVAAAVAGYAERCTGPTGDAPSSGFTVDAEGMALVVRGDALNPLTDRWMRFRHASGPRGQKVLEAFGEGATIAELAIAHGVELSELQRWVNQWGEEW